MSILLLILMASLLVAALERTNRRKPPHPPGLSGYQDPDDRDWARTQLDLSALRDQPRVETTRQHRQHLA